MSSITLKLPKPHPAQRAILDSTARFRVVMAGRRFGKSVISQADSVEKSVHGKRVAYITPTYQLGKIFFQEMVKTLPEKIFKKNESDLVMNFITGGSIRFFTGERLDALRGLKFHHAVIDEASYISNLEDGWLNSIRPTLTDYKGTATFISTPRGKNFFYSLFCKAESEWQSFKFSTYDNPHIDPSEIDAARMQLPGPVFEQEYMANPMENAANPFGSQHISACIIPELAPGPVAFYGIDLAKSVDWTVIIGLNTNGDVCYFDRFQKDWTQTKETIRQLPKHVPIMIDSTGNGDPITEDLQKHFNSMTGFKFTGPTKQQLMEGLVSAVHQKQIRFPDGPIKNELDAFEYTYTPTGVRYSAPVGFHDDCVCALALANKCRIDNRGSGQYYFL